MTKAGVSSEAAGVAYTEYSVDGGAWTRGSRVAVSSTSAHTVAFRSVDRAGNAEVTRKIVLAGKPTLAS